MSGDSDTTIDDVCAVLLTLIPSHNIQHAATPGSGASSRRLALAAERATGATPYRPLSCVTTNSKAAITTTAMSAIVIAISIAPPGWSSVSNRLCNAAHQARTLLPPHRIGALP